MSCDDDTFLGAYMDGQLDSEQQQLVESALVSSPQLAERLRRLSAVRDLVVGLRRDGCVDVTSRVMARIHSTGRPQSQRFARRQWSSQLRPIAAVAGTTTVAAGIILVVTLVTSVQPRLRRGEPSVRNSVDTTIADSKSDIIIAATDDRAITVAVEPGPSLRPRGISQSIARDTSPALLDPHGDPARDRDAHPSTGDLELSRRFLDNPYQRRFFMVRNGRDGTAQQQVSRIVEHTTRFGFFKITVSQGIVIDPRHPDEATVFALLVGPTDFDRFREQLKVAFSDLVEETPSDPAIVTQLADIGQVQACSPAPLGEVSISREDLALLTKVRGGTDNTPQPAAPVRGQTVVSRQPEKQEPSAAFPGPVQARNRDEAERDNAALTFTTETVHEPDGPLPRTTQLPDQRSEKRVATSEADLAAEAATRPKADDMVLVFVWVRQPRSG